MNQANTNTNQQVNEKNKSSNTSKKDIIIRSIVYGSLVICVFSLYGYKPLIYNYNIINAENCFKKEDYVCAFNYYRNAFKINKENDTYVSNYVTTLDKIKKITIVQEELNNLIETFPEHESIETVKNIFSEIRNKVEEEFPNTYIDNVIQGTNIVHWNNYEGKIKVYINSSSASNIPDYYINEIKNAFNAYNKILDNALVFEFISDEKQANIIVLFANDIIGDNCKTDKCPKVLGLTENEISGNALTKSTIKLRTKDTDETQLTANQIHNIVKHEIGHALGIAGHSYYSDDVLYPVSNDASFDSETYTLKIARKDFSQRDIQTLKLLYKIVPDITNKPYNTKVISDMYYPVAVLGTKDEIAEKKLEESKTYSSMVETNFISAVTLAEGFFTNKQYDKAEEKFLEALRLATADEEKFIVYNNLAVISYQNNKYEDGITYADMANLYSAKKEANEIKAYCYLGQKKYNKAERLLIKLTETNPENIVFSSSLTEAYIKQFKFIKAISEMKRIKTINPLALSDSSFARFSFLHIFVW